MDDFVIDEPWRDRVGALVAGRGRTVALASAGAALAAAGLVAAGREPARIAPPATATPSAPVAPADLVLVHVGGAVEVPGLYELAAGARVADAIDAAGGPRRVADLDAVNLAQIVADGSKIDVPRRGDPVPPLGPAAASVPSVVDLNAADLAALETIPGIGPAKARAILDHRALVGRFASIDELLDVRGIGPATLEAIRSYVTV